MNRYLAVFLLSVLFVGNVSAQNTKANAKKLFAEGRYEEAKPVLAVLLKNSPRNGELNYWYAVCCNETADTAANVEELLKVAVSRKVAVANDYLGDFYKQNFRYQDAIAAYEAFLKITKDNAAAERCEEKILRTKELLRMLKTTEQVCVIDSFVVNKERFLEAYRCGRDAGRIELVSKYFGVEDAGGTLTETERGTDIYFSQPVMEDSVAKMKIFHSSKNGREWSKAARITGFDTGGNENYPFMSADGTTFYFASDGEGSIGGYDIFVTRYNSERGCFLLPNNVGMPFNSEANDYMMAVNEIANLGWFATDRRMPQGMVCVYVFVPNSVRSVYDFENEEYDRMVALSQLTSIAETQTDEDVVRNARRQLTMLLYEQKDEKERGDFLFVLDDMTDYVRLSDFRSSEARKLFEQWRQQSVVHEKNKQLLEKKREQYAAANAAAKERMRNELITLEQRVESEQSAIEGMEKEIRNKEIEFIKK